MVTSLRLDWDFLTPYLIGVPQARLALRGGQEIVAGDWHACYESIKKGRPRVSLVRPSSCSAIVMLYHHLLGFFFRLTNTLIQVHSSCHVRLCECYADVLSSPLSF